MSWPGRWTAAPFSDRSVDKLMVDEGVKKATRERFPHGRSNVVADNLRNGHENLHRGGVGRTIADNVMSRIRVGGMSDTELHDEYDRTYGAAAALVGAGYCDEHAMTASVVLAAVLSPGKQIHRVGSTIIGHSWVEHELASHPETTGPVGQSGADRPESPIVLDTWSDGPVMKSTGARWAKKYRKVSSRTSISYQNRKTTTGAFDQTRKSLEREWTPKIDAMIKNRKRKVGEWPQDDPGLWQSNPVVDPAFAQRSRDLIANRDQDDVLRLAAGVAEKVLGLFGLLRLAMHCFGWKRQEGGS